MVAAEACHAFELECGNGIGLRTACNALVISSRHRIVHEDVTSLVTEREHPVRDSSAHHVIAGNENDSDGSGVEGAYESRFVERSQVGRNSECVGLVTELRLGEPHDAPLV